MFRLARVLVGCTGVVDGDAGGPARRGLTAGSRIVHKRKPVVPLALLTMCLAGSISAPSLIADAAATSRGIASVHVQVLQTADGSVAYRQPGKGRAALLLIMALGGNIDDWEPAFINALAAHHKVIVFNNAGVGRTSPLPSPLTVTAMAEQTSAFISAVRLRRADVLGWSLGGMVAQALTVLHPAQVRQRKQGLDLRFPCRPRRRPTP